MSFETLKDYLIRHTFTNTSTFNRELCLCSAGFSHHTAVVGVRVHITCTYGTVGRGAVFPAYTARRAVGVPDTLAIIITFLGQTRVRQSYDRKKDNKNINI